MPYNVILGNKKEKEEVLGWFAIFCLGENKSTLGRWGVTAFVSLFVFYFVSSFFHFFFFIK